jgi:hypothetical protein
MAKFEITLDTKQLQPLTSLCKLQSKIISELHEQVYNSPELDAKVDELQRMFESANLDEALRKIQYETFAGGFIAGFIHGEDVDCAASLDNATCNTFEEWVKRQCLN